MEIGLYCIIEGEVIIRGGKVILDRSSYVFQKFVMGN